MRRGPLVERLAKRARFCQVVRAHLTERGFLEVQTPVLTASSPEGARDYLVPSRLYPGEFYALPQAPQQFKQLLMVGGVERYFQIAPCFQGRGLTGRPQPRRVLPDRPRDGLRHPGGRLHRGRAALRPARRPSCSAKQAPAPFPRLSYADAMARYGTDKPDLRFGLEIVDVTGELGGRTELPMFAEAPARGHVIRALRAPGAAERPRSWFDTFGDAAKGVGSHRELATADRPTRRAQGPAVPTKLTPEEMGTLVAATGAGAGDAVLTCVGPPPTRPASRSARYAPRSGATSGWPTPTCWPFAG